MEMQKGELLHTPVTFYNNMKSWNARQITIDSVLSAIKGDYYACSISQIRSLKAKGKNDAANEIKSNLPAVTFAATFEGRRISELCQHYNSLLVIDIDKLDNEEMGRVKECLLSDSYVGCFWISPSGNGWKGLISLDYDEKYNKTPDGEKHHLAFLQIESYFHEKYGIELDASGKDITRLCYMSWCPDLIIKNEFDKFHVSFVNKAVEKGSRVSNTQDLKSPDINRDDINWNIIDGQKQEHDAVAYNRRTIERIYKYLKSRNLSITESYIEWVKVAYAISNSFHSVYGRNIFMRLCELDGSKHDAVKSESLIYNAYIETNKQCDMGTILYLAHQKGFNR